LLNKKGALFLIHEWENLRGEDIHDLAKAGSGDKERPRSRASNRLLNKARLRCNVIIRPSLPALRGSVTRLSNLFKEFCCL
jgi:hypothetical protein